MQLLALIIFLATCFIAFRVIRKSQRALDASPMVRELPPESPSKYSAQEMLEAQEELKDIGTRN